MELLQRPRRLRTNQQLRSIVKETHLSIDDLILPLFIKEGKNINNSIKSMPGHFQLSVDNLNKELDEIAKLKLKGVMLFGIPAFKDEKGSSSLDDEGIIQQAIRYIKSQMPELIIMADVCLCEYTDHGHCGVINSDNNRLPANRFSAKTASDSLMLGSTETEEQSVFDIREDSSVGATKQDEAEVDFSRKYNEVENDPSISLLAKQALSFANAGADLVAPSAMMDGMVLAIRRELDVHGYKHLPIMSYAVKYASAMYGPFRMAAEGAPKFGDRKSYQMDYANSNEALKEAKLDIEQGADIIMVKPAHTYLDVILKVKQKFPETPLAAYHTSGEYAMIKAAAQNNWIDEQAAMLEITTAIKRAGADLIISYYAKDLAKKLQHRSSY